MQPELVVSSLPVAGLVPYAENARTHSTAQVAQIAASIAEFGFVNPVLVDVEGVLIAGHGRVMAAKQLGLASVPVLLLGHLSPAQARALRLADNQIALNSGWDEALLAAEIARIRDEAVVDLDVLGFSGMELDRLLAAADAGLGDDADDAPPPPVVPVTRTGDLWRCGDHRLLCGDATKLVDVQRALGAGHLADMGFVDPPYNVAYEGGTAAKMTIANDALGGGFPEFLRPALANLLSVTKGACYVCMSSSEWPTLHRVWQEAGGKWSSTIIWAKNTFALGRADYHQQFEAMLYGWRQGSQHYWCGARDQGNVWHFDKPARNDLHPTMKPVALVERAIRNSSKPRDTVLDCFGGSGTTMIAAERTGRRAVLLEIDPAYADVIVQRWQEATGDLDENDANFPHADDPSGENYYRVLIDRSREEIVAKLGELKRAIEAGTLRDWEFQGIKAMVFEHHLYQPLLYCDSALVEIKPVPLNKGERDFVEDLRAFCESGAGKGYLAGKQLYLLRNMSRGRGVGFFEAGNFYPDFILWLVIGGQQRVLFIDPKGIRNLGKTDPKIEFYKTIKEIENRLGAPGVEFDSFIISNTAVATMEMLWSLSKQDMEQRHILFQIDDKLTYVGKMFGITPVTVGGSV